MVSGCKGTKNIALALALALALANNMIDVERIVPHGVLCLYSAFALALALALALANLILIANAVLVYCLLFIVHSL